MPYTSEGGIKYTDHQIRSPLYNMANSCQVCHKWTENEIVSRVNSMQDKNKELLNMAEDALVLGHLAIGDAMKRGATESELHIPREDMRYAQMYWDYVAANNGMGFHAPQECARVLAIATNLAQKSLLMTERLRTLKGAKEPYRILDISTEEKAKAFVKPFVDAQTSATAQPVAK